MINRICIAIIVMLIMLSGCSKFNQVDVTTDTGNNATQNTIESVTASPHDNNSSKTLVTDEKYNASICYDRGFYFKIDTQTYKLKDDCIDAPAIIADEFEYPRPIFNLFTINSDNIYFVVTLIYPTNGSDSTAYSWFFVYQDNILKLIREQDPYNFTTLLPEYINYKCNENGTITFAMPDLDREITLRPTNPNFEEHDNGTFRFSLIRDIYVQDNLITFDTIIYSNKSHCTLSGEIHLTYEINKNDINLIKLTGPQ